MSKVSGSDNFFNYKFFFPFDQVWGQFGIVGAVDFVFLVECKSTSIGDVVNVLLAVGQLQLDVDSSNGVNDFK